jgi:hypothetical protein
MKARIPRFVLLLVALASGPGRNPAASIRRVPTASYTADVAAASARRVFIRTGAPSMLRGRRYTV